MADFINIKIAYAKYKQAIEIDTRLKDTGVFCSEWLIDITNAYDNTELISAVFKDLNLPSEFMDIFCWSDLGEYENSEDEILANLKFFMNWQEYELIWEDFNFFGTDDISLCHERLNTFNRLKNNAIRTIKE